MTSLSRRWMFAAVFAVALWSLSAAGVARAGAGVEPDDQDFVLTTSSAYARAEPDSLSTPLFSMFQGDVLPLRARSADGAWLLVAGSQTEGWVLAAAGALAPAGQANVEAVLAEAVGGLAAIRTPPDGVVPVISDRARAIYRRGLALGNLPGVFAKVGDCNTENGRFLSMFDEPGEYRLGAQYAYLQSTIDNFSGSFSIDSAAAHSGFSPAAVLSPVWANPNMCQPGESPLQCEYRRLRPSVALVNLGTHPGPNRAEFEMTMRQVIYESIALGVLPILATKADDVEEGGWINDVVRDLALEYELPLWDFWKAAQPLPGNGLSYTGIHPTYGRSHFDDPWAMTRGWTWRNLTALLALDAVLAGVADVSLPASRGHARYGR